MLTLLFSRAVVIAFVRLIILSNENLDNIACKLQCFDLHIEHPTNTAGIYR